MAPFLFDHELEPGFYWARLKKTHGVANEWEPFEVQVDTIGGYFCGSDVFTLTKEIDIRSRLVPPVS